MEIKMKLHISKLLLGILFFANAFLFAGRTRSAAKKEREGHAQALKAQGKTGSKDALWKNARNLSACLQEIEQETCDCSMKEMVDKVFPEHPKGLRRRILAVGLFALQRRLVDFEAKARDLGTNGRVRLQYVAAYKGRKGRPRTRMGAFVGGRYHDEARKVTVTVPPFLVCGETGLPDKPVNLTMQVTVAGKCAEGSLKGVTSDAIAMLEGARVNGEVWRKQ